MKNQLPWFVVPYLPKIGPVTFRRWLTHFQNNIDALFSASTTDLQNAGLTPIQIHHLKSPDWELAEKDSIWLEKNHAKLLTITDAEYPTLLQEIHDAPIVLYVQGDTSLLTQPQIAIVGSRNPTIAGQILAEQFAKRLAEAGLIITSGLAAGIDAASHQGAIAMNGKTLAVMGTGLRSIYPRANRKLAEKIIEQGALITEFTPDTLPKAKNFPQRNRIISGLSLGVLVVEAAIRSGSLITAKSALEQNREVFAIPGSIHNPLARGCHQLIKQGAKLVETAEDILEELGSLNATLAAPIKAQPIDLNSQLQKIMQQIGYEVTALDVIIARSGLTAGEVSSMLLALELRGCVHAVPGGYVCAMN